MKIGVLSDTHLHHVTPPLRRIFERYLADADVVLHAGDVVAVDVVRFLDQGNFFGVSGNMDPPEVRKILPPFRTLELGGWKIGLTHGGGSPAMLESRVRQLFPDVDVIVYGHSHVPVCHRLGDVLMFNPGSATGPSRYRANTLGMLEVGERVTGRIVELPDEEFIE